MGNEDWLNVGVEQGGWVGTPTALRWAARDATKDRGVSEVTVGPMPVGYAGRKGLTWSGRMGGEHRLTALAFRSGSQTRAGPLRVVIDEAGRRGSGGLRVRVAREGEQQALFFDR